MYSVKGRADVSECSIAASRRRRLTSQKRDSVIAHMNATIPTTIPAMAPVLRDFEELSVCVRVIAEIALAPVESVSVIMIDLEVEIDWKSEVGCERERDPDSAGGSDVDLDSEIAGWEGDVESGGEVDVDWESDVDGEFESGVDCEGDEDDEGDVD